MIKSIRKYILIYLGFTISFFAILLIGISSFYLDQKDVQLHLDSVMSISALTFDVSIDKLNFQNYVLIQTQFEDILKNYVNHVQLPHFQVDKYVKNFDFQIYDLNGHKIISSTTSPRIPPNIIFVPGFHNINIDNNVWRFFVSKHPKMDIMVIVGVPQEIRTLIVRRITRDDFLILLLIFPISAILIWWTVTKSLVPLKQVTKEIKARDPFNLKAMDVKHVPEEVQPLVGEINQLMSRLKNGLTREQAFAADAAHELRTPLATIKTLAQTAKDYQNLEQIKSILDKIIHSVDRGSHVVQQLMNMSKTMPEALLLSEFITLDLVQLTRDTLSNLMPQALEKNMDIELEAEQNLPQIQGNKIAIEILIRNLVDNAIRYSFPNTNIFVNLYRNANHVVFEIRDQGPGIPKSKQDKVFDRFYRAHDPNPKLQGSGLGLAIVKQIASLHQAQINLESPKANAGVTIRIFFPIVPQRSNDLSPIISIR